MDKKITRRGFLKETGKAALAAGLVVAGLSNTKEAKAEETEKLLGPSKDKYKELNEKMTEFWKSIEADYNYAITLDPTDKNNLDENGKLKQEITAKLIKLDEAFRENFQAKLDELNGPNAKLVLFHLLETNGHDNFIFKNKYVKFNESYHLEDFTPSILQTSLNETVKVSGVLTQRMEELCNQIF